MSTRKYNNWTDDFLYSGKNNYKILQKYCDYLSGIFRSDLVQFGYTRFLKNDDAISMSLNVPSLMELYVDAQAYIDSPLLVKHDKIKSGCVFSWPGYVEEHTKENNFRHMKQKNFGICNSFHVIEKSREHSEIFSFGFQCNTNLSTFEEQTAIMKDYISKVSLLKMCIEQFHGEFLPILSKGGHDVPLNLMKGSLIDSQEFILGDNADDVDLLYEMNILDQEEQYLQDVKLTKQEERCLSLYLLGMTAEEIANEITRSRRTVESHINNIKTKLRVTKRSEVHAKAKLLKNLGNINLSC